MAWNYISLNIFLTRTAMWTTISEVLTHLKRRDKMSVPLLEIVNHNNVKSKIIMISSQFFSMRMQNEIADGTNSKFTHKNLMNTFGISLQNPKKSEPFFPKIFYFVLALNKIVNLYCRKRGERYVKLKFKRYITSAS